MATPIAHKDAVAGVGVVAMTVLDLMTTPALIADARDDQQNVQLEDQSLAQLGIATRQANWPDRCG